MWLLSFPEVKARGRLMGTRRGLRGIKRLLLSYPMLADAAFSSRLSEIRKQKMDGRKMEEREKRRTDKEKRRYTPKVVFRTSPVPTSEGVFGSPYDRDVSISYRNPPFRTEE